MSTINTASSEYTDVPEQAYSFCSSPDRVYAIKLLETHHPDIPDGSSIFMDAGRTAQAGELAFFWPKQGNPFFLRLKLAVPPPEVRDGGIEAPMPLIVAYRPDAGGTVTTACTRFKSIHPVIGWRDSAGEFHNDVMGGVQ